MAEPGATERGCGSKVLLDFSYIGTGYHGVAFQADEPNTVEGHLFAALANANMAANVMLNGYERCGRTDRDVHALHNYCSFFLDKCSPDGPCSSKGDAEGKPRKCYRIKGLAKAVNKLLPRNIRVNRVHCVPDDFSARRSCLGRTYKYFFQLGDMNLDAMQEACRAFVGTHNFMQFCKMDNRNPKDPNTTVHSFTVERYNDLLCVATVAGRSFLWHQVRCMVGVLFLVGSGAAAADIVRQLLERPNGQKYNYRMGSPHGLVLFKCDYDIELDTRKSGKSAAYQEALQCAIQVLGPLSLMASGA